MKQFIPVTLDQVNVKLKWSMTNKKNTMSQKYEVDLYDIPMEIIELLTTTGYFKADRKEKPDRICCKSQKPIPVFINDIKYTGFIGNETEANVVLRTELKKFVYRGFTRQFTRCVVERIDITNLNAKRDHYDLEYAE